MDLVAQLNEFIERTGKQPFVWGVSDCSAAPVAWFNEAFGYSIKLPCYSDKEGAHNAIAKHGDLVGIWSAIAYDNTIPERHGDPELGDIAIIDTRLYGQIGGICGVHNVIFIRLEDGRCRPFGPVRKFLKVFAGQ